MYSYLHLKCLSKFNGLTAKLIFIQHIFILFDLLFEHFVRYSIKHLNDTYVNFLILNHFLMQLYKLNCEGLLYYINQLESLSCNNNCRNDSGLELWIPGLSAIHLNYKATACLLSSFEFRTNSLMLQS